MPTVLSYPTCYKLVQRSPCSHSGCASNALSMMQQSVNSMMQVRAGMKKALKELGSGGRAENAEQPAAASATTSPSTADVTEL